MEIETILYILIGIIVIFILLKRKRIDINYEYDSYSEPENEWSILTSFSELKILSKYVGELRFGPAFVYLKSEPENIFEKEIYGDWFYRTENGVYLQKWNSNPIERGVLTKANNDLIYYDKIKNKIEIIETGINSFHWEIEKNNENELTLISNNGKRKSRKKITTANTV